jgi:hypothetical protein
VSTFTILYTLHEAGYSWQKSRTWCETGKTLRKKNGRVEESYDEYTQEKTQMIERAYVIGERLGLQVWCEDEAGPYQTIPQPCQSWRWENQPARQAHQYLRGKTAKLLTLCAAGDRRTARGSGSAKHQCHSASWLKRELTAILKQYPPVPKAVPPGRRWQDWDIYPAADQLDRFFPSVRILLSLR